MTTTKKITVVGIVATIILWTAWDFVPGFNSEVGDTISETFRNWGWQAPAFVWAIGALCGHFWGTADVFVNFRVRFPWVPAVLAGVGLLLAGVNGAGVLPRIHPMISFLVGVPMGALLWPQKHPDDSDGKPSPDAGSPTA